MTNFLEALLEKAKLAVMNSEVEKTAEENLGGIMKITPEQVRNIEWIPLFEYDGIKWPTFPSFRAKGIEQGLKDIMNIQTRDTDIMICTHAKSGTHWIYEITKMLLDNNRKLVKNSKANVMLEVLPSFAILDTMPSPRLLDTHVQFQYLPVKHIEKRNKIIHMLRNPKDVLVSLYYHAKKDVFLNLNVPFNEFFYVWMSGNVPYGSWYDYELGLEQAEKDYPGMIYTCYYEDMKKYPEREIKKLADFLEVKRTDETIKSIAKETSFDNMQENKFDATSVFDEKGKGFIYRKGEIGDWKNHFTVAQSDQFDAQYQEKMKDSKYKFTFE